MAQADDALSVSLRGVTDLPPGKIAEVVTYLEMLDAPARREAPPGGFTLERFSDLTRYRALFRRVGERWLWMSRLVMPEAELRAILDSPGSRYARVGRTSASWSSTSGSPSSASSPISAWCRRRSGRERDGS
jgi:hypothetical protein